MSRHVSGKPGRWLALIALLAGGAPTAARANGRQDEVLTGQVRAAGGEPCRLAAVVDPLQLVVTLGGKYHLLRVNIDNRSGRTPLSLSATADRAQVEIGGATIDAVLDLAGEDAAFWNTLPLEARKLLHYPQQVEGQEQASIILLVPASKVAALTERRPQLIRLTLASAGRVELRPMVAAK